MHMTSWVSMDLSGELLVCINRYIVNRLYICPRWPFGIISRGNYLKHWKVSLSQSAISGQKYIFECLQVGIRQSNGFKDWPVIPVSRHPPHRQYLLQKHRAFHTLLWLIQRICLINQVSETKHYLILEIKATACRRMGFSDVVSPTFSSLLFLC